jgi:hypothetical protein
MRKGNMIHEDQAKKTQRMFFDFDRIYTAFQRDFFWGENQ